ncbi:MAG: hypothetical protein U0V45_05075 [Flavobacteriales bacterium]
MWNKHLHGTVERRQRQLRQPGGHRQFEQHNKREHFRHHPARNAQRHGLRIRVVSSDPGVTGSDNGSDISIGGALPPGNTWAAKRHFQW